MQTVPIIMMTAKTSEFDIVKGLDCGADDYVTKPFGIMELLSRIRSVLRRAKKAAEPNKKLLSYGHIVVDQEQHIATSSGKEIQLTLKEFDLLCYLLLKRASSCLVTRSCSLYGTLLLKWKAVPLICTS